MQQILDSLQQAQKQTTYFGPQGFVLAGSNAELADFQRGYRIDPDGKDLTGSAPTDWQPDWHVIAIDTELGDPYFVDANDTQLPVYTAVHADGIWHVDAVASSLDAFIECLALLSNHGGQETAQLVPDETTITDKSVLTQLQENLAKISGCAGFWTLFFECYVDWLQDDDG